MAVPLALIICPPLHCGRFGVLSKLLGFTPASASPRMSDGRQVGI